jgi:hypothetical protein
MKEDEQERHKFHRLKYFLIYHVRAEAAVSKLKGGDDEGPKGRQ